MGDKIKVLIVDDSAVVRQTLAEILNSDPDIEVMGVAADPYYAASKIAHEVPDVITLDIEMPRMDGLTFLRKIMTQHPIPVVIISSLTEKGTETGIRALEYGAVEIITKPKMGTKEFIEESKIRIRDAVKAASAAKLHRKKVPPLPTRPMEVKPKLSADAIMPKSSTSDSMIKTTEKVIVVGASTGGTEALRIFLEELPADCPGIVIVQHMPEQFTRSFADRLDQLCKISVKEAANNDTVIRGRALIAPGNHHLILKRSGARYYVEINDGPLVNRHRPSVDVLFRSTAKFAGKNAVGVIMTGMGDDGARGLLELKEAGAHTIAQDEKSCIVFGMPKEAIKLDAAEFILPLEVIAQKVLKLQY
ncbi:MAG: chemotaxis response regulator protein-glutamate methylesterase [Bacteroidetes bacterium GWA2_40_14]|jgi:two-component system chemotaxis response regulator CheB|nr:MAG: chemotaxis response regulator protein-glutamate methylesterase [Bacteroidetes bacterium GWA2_40_14]OFX61919.1 MAG: chemotaxis response regulator protein-glutamate methylesterase [Bacteroidetes bacterium GWC2_40_13]HBO74694.1 chemotaxis response regulator protein-glutamate methylesterase [Marinilabiliales bacterium]